MRYQNTIYPALLNTIWKRHGLYVFKQTRQCWNRVMGSVHAFMLASYYLPQRIDANRNTNIFQ